MGVLTAVAPGHYRLSGPMHMGDPLETLPLAPLEAVGDVVTIDLAELGATDSVMLAVLLEWDHAARRAGRTLTIINVPPRLKELIRVSGLGALFPT
ncbi:MAG: STAS domain-containing protein [Acidiferrobacter sp.]